MKHLLVAMIGLLALAAGPINVDSSADDVLDALDARGKDLKTLSADVTMTDTDPTIGEPGDSRTGHLYYELLPSGDSRWRAIFDKKITDGRMVEQKHEWCYAKGSLIERDYRTKVQSTNQILKPGEKMQLFTLEGPFPLPLGQDKADVHKHFDVRRLPLDKDGPPATVHLQLSPLPGTDIARKFKTIDLWVDPKTEMPVRITVLDADGNNLRQTDLSNPKVNEPAREGDFQIENIDLQKEGWNAHDG